jgi:4,5-DOPA dioxygenase extradiol
MKRQEFLTSMIGVTAMTTLGGLKKYTDDWVKDGTLMPVLFVGHGSPMNAIEDNIFTKGWKDMSAKIPKPKAILCISAHWETKGSFVTVMEKPETIHDFGGFPQALIDVQYPAQGSKWLAQETQNVVKTVEVGLSNDWGLDHGCWSVLKHLYPKANVPVIQLSLDYTKGAQYHYDLGRQLMDLRKKGVLIIGSGNMVHNFQYAQFSDSFNKPLAHDWAIEANEKFKSMINDNNTAPLINYQNYSKAFQLSAPTPEHYLPLLYSIALRKDNDAVSFYNDEIVAGSFSMTSVLIENE